MLFDNITALFFIFILSNIYAIYIFLYCKYIFVSLVSCAIEQAIYCKYIVQYICNTYYKYIGQYICNTQYDLLQSIVHSLWTSTHKIWQYIANILSNTFAIHIANIFCNTFAIHIAYILSNTLGNIFAIHNM